MFKKYLTIKLSEVVKNAKNNGVGMNGNAHIQLNDHFYNIEWEGDIYLHKNDRVKITEYYIEDNLHKLRKFEFVV